MQRVDRNFVLPRSKRQHGIDVIKSIAMLMVVTLHVIGHGGILAACEPASHTLESAVFLESAAIIAVDLFVLSSGYLGYGSSHGLVRILQLWLQTFFWSLSIGVLFDALDLVPGDQISYKQLLFPILNSQNWYMSTYFGLLLFMPLLDKAVEAMTRKQAFEFILAGTLLLTAFSFLSPVDAFGLGRGYSLVWFIYLYLVGAILRANEPKARSLNKKTARFLLAAYVLLLLVNYTCLLNAANPSPSDALGSKILYYNAPFVYISALVLFVLLIGLKCKNAILASSLASINTVLLDVYLIHEHPLVRSIFISGRFSSFAQHGPIGLAVLTILLVVMIFTTCIALGQLRHCIFKALHVRDLSIQIERLIAQTIDRMYESTAKFIS